MKHRSQHEMAERFKRLIAYDPLAGLHRKKRAEGGRVSLDDHIEKQAKVVDRRPTDGQKEAGNYRKGHVKVHGLDISIENPRGSWRTGGPEGHKWRSKLPNHYGYIRKTDGADGDHVDCYIGPHLKAPNVFVVDQHDLGSKTFDEHKCFIGFGSKSQAREAYHQAFSDGRGKDRIGHIETLSVPMFKLWLEHGNTKAPINRADGGKVRFADFRRSDNIEDRREEQSFKQDPPSSEDWQSKQIAATSDDNPLSKALGVQDVYAKRADGGSIHMADGGIPSFDQTRPVNAAAPPPFEATQPVAPDIGKVRSVYEGAKAGATFNFNDELAGASAAANHAIPDWAGVIADVGNPIIGGGKLAYEHMTTPENAPHPTMEAYTEARDKERATNELAKAQHPYLHMAGEIAGSLPVMAALPGAEVAQGANLATKAVKGAQVGAEYGGLSGLGEGKDAGERALGSAEGIVSGIVGGAAAPLVGGAAGLAYDRFGKPVVNAVRGAMNPEAEAARRLATSLRADQELVAAGKAQGMSPTEWIQARANGEPVTLADLGSTNTQALLRSAANTSPEGRAILEKVINDRFAGQTERVANEVRGLVAGGANAGKTGDQLVAEYDRARAPAYKQAFQQGDKEIVSPTIERLMGAPMFESAMKSAVTTGKDRAITEGYGAFNPGVTVENGMIKFTKTKPNGVPQYPNLQYWDSVKKELDSVASVARRQGDMGKADVAGNMAKTLRSELDQQVPSYANARGIASQYFGESNALEAGQKLAGKRVDPKVISDAMRKMKPDEQELFREGYASDWAGRVIGNMSDSRDITKAMFNSPNERARALAVFGPAGAQKMEARMTLETIMDGARKAMGNSTTARQLIEAGLAGGTLEGYLSGWDPTHMAAGFAGAAGARKALGTEMAAGARKLVGKVDSRTAKLVAELLTSNDPNKLQQGLRMAQKNQRIADGLRNVANRVALAGQNEVPRPSIPYLQGPVPAGANDEQNQPKGVAN